MSANLRALIILAALAAALPAPAAHAGERRHDEVRRAVERGEIKPLATILESVRARLPGEITSVEIEQKKGRWLYELRTLGPEGRMFDVYVDAATADIVRVKEK